MQLAKELGITQQAWLMRQRIHEACNSDDDDGFLDGVVEIDETQAGMNPKCFFEKLIYAEPYSSRKRS